MKRFLLLCLTVLSGLLSVNTANAESKTIDIDMKDGVITPLEIRVPANTMIRLNITNSGTKPAEFESTELYKEKVLAPGVNRVMVIKKLSPGEYKFFDDFSPGSKHATIIAE
ncbi:cupredoxin domain-containing protein [Brackiella oedipodis]|uniref:cupredoxin domain-containing protein n=1 Tax=Brackiella oedipodis TaxID=124225 RepID=UPI000491EC35|nr:cupredoxin domain-containing protein [Brackiella oedipodis]